MFTSNIQFRYPCPRGGGQAVQAGLSCLPPRILVKQCHRLILIAPPPPGQDLGQTVYSLNLYCTIILEYLVVRAVNIISAKLRCLHLTFSLVILVRGVGARCPGWFILPPRAGFRSGSVISQFILHYNLGIFSCKRCEHYFSQTETFTANVQFGYPCQRVGGGGKLSSLVFLAPRQGLWSNSVIS